MTDRRGSPACAGFHATDLTRRCILKAGGLGLLGLTLPGLLRAEAMRRGPRPRARSIIFLFQFGGPSHIDMLDPKPDAPDGIRGPYRPIATSAPEIRISERLPQLAKVMNRVTLIRSMHHEMKNHNSASYYALTGHAPPLDDIRLRDSLELFPAYGSVVDRFLPQDAEVPAFVSYPHVIRDGSVTPGQHASFLGKAHDPFFLGEDPASPDFQLPELSLPAGLTLSRVEKRREIQRLIDRQSKLLEASAEARGLDEYYQRAIAMLSSARVREAFNISAEAEEVRARYGGSTFGQGCLLARRLVEAGVRFVTVYFSNSIGGQSTTSGGWDTHGFNNTRMFPIIEAYHLPMTDRVLPALIEDLDQRGLLDETLVVWMGEFGRTPKINENASRPLAPVLHDAAGRRRREARSRPRSVGRPRRVPSRPTPSVPMTSPPRCTTSSGSTRTRKSGTPPTGLSSSRTGSLSSTSLPEDAMARSPTSPFRILTRASLERALRPSGDPAERPISPERTACRARRASLNRKAFKARPRRASSP